MAIFLKDWNAHMGQLVTETEENILFCFEMGCIKLPDFQKHPEILRAICTLTGQHYHSNLHCKLGGREHLVFGFNMDCVKIKRKGRKFQAILRKLILAV